MKTPHYILNKKLNGVPVAESHDHIIEAMKLYAEEALREAAYRIEHRDYFINQEPVIKIERAKAYILSVLEEIKKQ